jgi:hypothetical protein
VAGEQNRIAIVAGLVSCGLLMLAILYVYVMLDMSWQSLTAEYIPRG